MNLEVNCCSGNHDNVSSASDEQSTYGPVQLAVMATVLTLLSLATTFGNLLVIVSITVERNLRTITNCFIMSLAIADVTIGIISMPLFTSMMLTGRWLFGSLVCDLWLSIDYAVSNASVASLIIITCDRYLNVTRPLTYRAKRTKKRAALGILLAWGVSVLLWTPGIISWQYVDGQRAVPEDKCYVQFLLSSKTMTLGTAAVAFYVPVLAMLVLYWRVYAATRDRDRELQQLRAKCADRIALRASVRASLPALTPRRLRVPSTSPPHFPRVNHAFLASNSHSQPSPPSPSSWIQPSNSDRPVSDSNVPASPSSARHLPDNPLLVETSLSFTPPVPLSCKHSRRFSAIPQVPRRSIFSAPSLRRSQSTNLVACKSKRRMQVRSDAKAAKTISAVLLAFIVTWTPYNVFAVVRAFCGGCIADWIFDFGYLLCYINSTINPVCYAMCNESFRKTFKRIVQCKCRRRPIPSALFALAINLARATSAAAPHASLYATSVVYAKADNRRVID